MCRFINEIPCGVLIHTQCILFKAGETSLSPPNIYHLFMMETSTFPSGPPGGVQSVTIKNLNAHDWHGYIWLHSSESIHRKWRKRWKSNEDFLSGIIVSPCLGWHELSGATETQDD